MSIRVIDSDPLMAHVVASVLGGTAVSCASEIEPGDQLAIGLDQMQFCEDGVRTGWLDGLNKFAEVVAARGFTVPVVFYGWPHRSRGALDTQEPVAQILRSRLGPGLYAGSVIDIDDILQGLDVSALKRTTPRDQGLVHDLALHVVEKANAALRHAFGSPRRPAVRILLGALTLGMCSFEEAEVVLDLLKDHEKKRAEIEDMIASYPRAALLNYSLSGTYGQSQTSSEALPLRYLLCDDQLLSTTYRWRDGALIQLSEDGEWQPTPELRGRDTGWGPVLACVTKAEVVCCNSPSEMLARLPYEHRLCTHDRWDALLLDYDLQQHKNGGHYLIMAKQRQYDLPIAMFTGAEDANTTKWCLAHGACGYFVKETGDSDGRQSKEAYSSLSAILSTLRRISDPSRRLWRKYLSIECQVEQFEDTVLQIRGSEISPPAISFCLRQAFYWLFVAEPVERGSTTLEDTCSRNIAVYAPNALHELLRCHYLSQNKSFDDDRWGRLLSRTKGDRLLFCKVGLDPKHLGLKTASLKKVAHATHVGVQPVEMNAAVRAFEHVIDLLDTYLAQKPVGRRTDSSGRLSIPGSTPRPVPAATRGSNHAQTAALGSRDVITGWSEWMGMKEAREVADLWGGNGTEAVEHADLLHKACVPSSTNARRWTDKRDSGRILFIDDTPEDHGWANALRILFGPSSVDARIPQSIGGFSCDQIDSYDLVLLDLCMPSPDAGFALPSPKVGVATLRALRCLSKAVPIVVLTASDDAYWTRMCLVNGATNYFPKRVAPHRQKETVGQLTSLVWQLSAKMGTTSKVRRVWAAMGDVKRCSPGTSPDLGILESHSLAPIDADSDLIGWMQLLLGLRLDAVYDAYIGIACWRHNPNQFVNVHRWLVEGLHRPAFMLTTSHSGTAPLSHLLALECGKLVEFAEKVTEAYTRKDLWTEHNGWTDKSGISSTARDIKTERKHAAHGRLADDDLALIDHHKAAMRAVEFAAKWTSAMGWT